MNTIKPPSPPCGVAKEPPDNTRLIIEENIDSLISTSKRMFCELEGLYVALQPLFSDNPIAPGDFAGDVNRSRLGATPTAGICGCKLRTLENEIMDYHDMISHIKTQIAHIG